MYAQSFDSSLVNLRAVKGKNPVDGGRAVLSLVKVAAAGVFEQLMNGSPETPCLSPRRPELSSPGFLNGWLCGVPDTPSPSEPPYVYSPGVVSDFHVQMGKL